MGHDELQEVAPDIIARDRYPAKDDGRYGPSQVSGCPLKVYLNEMTDNQVVTNSYMFGGSAVHYYLQESGIMDEVLDEAGFHPALTDYEVTDEYEVQDGIYIHGSCDILTTERQDGPEHDPDTYVYDIKYSSIPPHTGHGRIYKYFAQAHTYARIFDADGYGLIMINSKESNDLRDAITVLAGEMSDDNWELIQQKVVNIHEALVSAGYYDGNRFTPDELEDVGKGFWNEIIEYFDITNIPSYDDECKYCDHKEYCPDYNGMFGGLNALID